MVPDDSGTTPRIKLTITMDPLTGQVRVEGSIEQTLLCYGLLEAAKDAIRNYAAQQASNQRILPVSAMPLIKQ